MSVLELNFIDVSLPKKNNKFIGLREKLFEYEPLLQEVLQAIYKSDSSYPAGCHVAALNYPELISQPFKDLDLDFSLGSFDGVKHAGKSCIELNINSKLPSDLPYKLYPIFDRYPTASQLEDIQSKIFKRSALIYHIATNTESSLDTKRRLKLQFASDIAKLKGISVLEILKKEIDDRILKAENSIIPKLAPIYMMAQIIMAFEKEAPHHRPQAAQ